MLSNFKQILTWIFCQSWPYLFAVNSRNKSKHNGIEFWRVRLKYRIITIGGVYSYNIHTHAHTHTNTYTPTHTYIHTQTYIHTYIHFTYMATYSIMFLKINHSSRWSLVWIWFLYFLFSIYEYTRKENESESITKY